MKKNYAGFLTAAIWGLVLFGLVMISSVSVFESHKLMVKNHGVAFCEIHNCNGFYFWKQIKYAVVGVFVFLVGFLTPTGFWKKMALPIFVGTIGLLVVLLVSSFGADWGTAKSWINIPFLPSIQPSEIAKLAIIFYLAVWMDKKKRAVKTWENGFLPFIFLMIPIVVLLALQPDFGSLLVIMAIATTMFFLAGGNFFHLFLGGAIAAFLIFLPVLFSHCDGENRGNFCYISERIDAFLGGRDTTTNYQVRQSLIAIGSGEIFGVGIGNSAQRHGWLPEVKSDTIFAAAAEELGFFRVILLIGLFAGITFAGLETAKNARNRFEMLVAGGITAWIAFQAIINIAVVTKLFPVTGITLPFISAGGSSLVSLLLASGILVRIAKFSSPKNENRLSRRRLGRAYFPRARRR